ncbi:MAG: ATP-binding cassette domain-containing protein [Deltaproteobacteria bacterium]|nr:ATP-binding cassette domain-containing protein [Deltaproteobacteria bacterium]
MLIQLQDVSFSYGGQTILRQATWQVNPQERIGLVGPNGCGKSTVLSLLARQVKPHGGSVAVARGRRIGYLPQDQSMDLSGSLRDSLLEPFADVLALRTELNQLEQRITDGDHDLSLLDRAGSIRHRYEDQGGYTLASRIEALISELGFLRQDLDRPMTSFSGGERSRIALAKVLIQEPDLILLDEPTNHLDIESTERLEGRLAAYPGAVVVVSHDRAFLNAVCTSIVELVDGAIEQFSGNFDRYRTLRAQRVEALQRFIAKQKAQIAKIEDYVARNTAGQKARQARSKKHILDRLDRIEVPQDPWVKAEDLRLRFILPELPGGKDVILAEDLAVGYDESLVEGFTLSVYRGDRVGIVGPNGTGKSTLLRVLVGRAEPLAGTIRFGHRLSIGYFDQNRSDLNPNNDLVDEIRRARGEISTDAARDILGALRFSGDDVFRPVSSLSGGEQNRLALGKLSLLPWSLLALDEPTNHLDIPARQALERSLVEYRGTLLVVSHDRYFLDRLVTKLVVLTPGRPIQVYWGNYSEYRRSQVAGGLRVDRREARQGGEEAKDERLAGYRARKEHKRVVERLARRCGDLEFRISEIEREIEHLDARIGAQGIVWADLEELVGGRTKLQSELEEKLATWERLSTELERLSQLGPEGEGTPTESTD